MTTTETIARQFLTGLDSMDIDAALSNFADNGVQELPFSPDGFPDRLDGIDALRRQYGGLPDAYTSMTFDVTAAYPMADPEWVALEYRGSIELAAGGRYDNDYIGLFHVVDGKIRLFREYFNPIILQRAFDTDSATNTFSLDTDSTRADQGTPT